jgi:hypothetical protein
MEVPTFTVWMQMRIYAQCTSIGTLELHFRRYMWVSEWTKEVEFEKAILIWGSLWPDDEYPTSISKNPTAVIMADLLHSIQP